MSERHAAGVVLILAVTFNAVLAIINANAHALNSAAVVGCEAALTAAAAALGLRGFLQVRKQWITLIGFMAALWLFNSFASGGFDIKLLRDVLLIPVFVLLGLRCDRTDLVRIVFPLQGFVVAVTLFEAWKPDLYGRLFNVLSYYVNTRGFSAEAFWNTNSDLFVSATRPDDRFLFQSLAIHRLSSIFLEPVSLGNYCVTVAIISAALWPTFSLLQRLFIGASEAIVLIGCDGRFATLSIAAVIVVGLVGSRLPQRLNWFYLPGVLAASAVVVSALGIAPVGDNFAGRTAGSIAMLGAMSATDLLGASMSRAYRVMDSGITYLVYSQSLLGAAAIWTFVALGLPQRDRATAVMIHGASLYFSLNLLISYSVFSIKTAALMWFCLGAIAAPAQRRWRGGAPSPLKTVGPTILPLRGEPA